MIQRHIIIWLIGTIIFLGVNLWFGERVVIEQFTKERGQITQTMGKDTAERIRGNTNTVYSFCCNWLAELTEQVFVPPTQDSYGVRDGVISSHQAFWTSVYMMVTRVFVIAEWMLVFWVVFLAAANHGLTKRAISVANTAWSSPVRYHLGLHYMVVVMGLLVNYILWPWTLHPFIAVGLLSIMCFVAFIITSNIQPKV